MTKDELIERLAELEFSASEGDFGPRYDQMDDEDRDEYRQSVMRYWPLIVDCVADWMIEYWNHSRTGQVQAHKWREEMV